MPSSTGGFTTCHVLSDKIYKIDVLLVREEFACIITTMMRVSFLIHWDEEKSIQ